MKKRILTALFISALLLVSCKAHDLVDTMTAEIPNDSREHEETPIANVETEPAQYTEDFNGYTVVYTHPHTTEVTDFDGKVLLNFEECDYYISGELLFIVTTSKDPDYLIYNKDLSPITADGKPAEFAHKFDEIAMCEDGGFTATTKNNGVLLRFAPDGNLTNSKSFEKLFTVGIKPKSGDPVAAAADGDTFKFVSSDCTVLAEIPFIPHLEYLGSNYSEARMTNGGISV